MRTPILLRAYSNWLPLSLRLRPRQHSMILSKLLYCHCWPAHLRTQRRGSELPQTGPTPWDLPTRISASINWCTPRWKSGRKDHQRPRWENRPLTDQSLLHESQVRRAQSYEAPSLQFLHFWLRSTCTRNHQRLSSPPDDQGLVQRQCIHLAPWFCLTHPFGWLCNLDLARHIYHLGTGLLEHRPD